MTVKALIIVAAVLLVSGCESMQQYADFITSHCSYEKDGQTVIMKCSK